MCTELASAVVAAIFDYGNSQKTGAVLEMVIASYRGEAAPIGNGSITRSRSNAEEGRHPSLLERPLSF